MKKIKIKRILLLFSLTIAMIGCFLVKSSNVKASDDLMAVDIAGSSNKSNIVFTEYCKNIDKVVCITNNSSICFLDYNTADYSEEIIFEDIPKSINQFRACVCGDYLIICKSVSSYVTFLKINLLTYELSSFNTSIRSEDYISIYKITDNLFYLGTYESGTSTNIFYVYKCNVDNLEAYTTSTPEKFYYNSSNYGCISYYICYADSKYVVTGGTNSYIHFFDYVNHKCVYQNNQYISKGYKLNNNSVIFNPYRYSDAYTKFRKFNLSTEEFSEMNESLNYSTTYSTSFFVDDKLYIVPIKSIGKIEVLVFNDFKIEGDNLIFTDVNTPLCHQDILSNYSFSDKYGRALMTSVKADSYYNSFSTPGNYEGIITVSDGSVSKDFDITIVVNKGGGEEEKKESSGSSIKWDTNLMIQSFGGIAVFLVLGLLVVSIIKKILK